MVDKTKSINGISPSQVSKILEFSKIICRKLSKHEDDPNILVVHGSDNEIYHLKLEDKSKPNGERLLTTELSVLKYLQVNSSIPICSVIEADLEEDNPIKSRFILKTAPKGKKLSSVFKYLYPEEKKRYLDQIIEIVKELSDMTLDNLGGIVDFDEQNNQLIVGEHIDTDLGPYDNYRDYIIDTFEFYINAVIKKDPKFSIFYQGFKTYIEKTLSGISSSRKTVLSHDDLYLDSFYVDEDTEKIIEVVNWERTSSTIDYKNLCSVLIMPDENASVSSKDMDLEDYFFEKCSEFGLERDDELDDVFDLVDVLISVYNLRECKKVNSSRENQLVDQLVDLFNELDLEIDNQELKSEVSEKSSKKKNRKRSTQK